MKALRRRRKRLQFEVPAVLFDQQTPDQLLSLSDDCKTLLKRTRVAVVGGGFAGLMAARRLGQQGVKVTVYEAREQVGGRVLSNHRFSEGRITEEGAELIGSFHTRWLTLARQHGLAMISRMDDVLYAREGLEVRLRLDRDVKASELDKLGDDMDVVLEKISVAASQITNPTRPWDNPTLSQYDKMSVAHALEHLHKVPPGGLVWKGLEFLLVNDEVAPLDEMNYLGLLCKVRGGQGKTLDGETLLMGYWDELEIFRCADGCQRLAQKMVTEIKAANADVKMRTAVTAIKLSKAGVQVESKRVIDRKGTLAPGPAQSQPCEYVILAIPPSVWGGVTFTAGKENVDPRKEIGELGMGPAVKFFTDVKERFWIKEGVAPYGGSLTLGQVWEGTDNQTRVDRRDVKQGIVLSVFAGPIVKDAKGRRAPNADECKKGLMALYPGYASNFVKPLFSDWPNEPFIRTGYASPTPGQIFLVAKELVKPFHDRLFFAGEHTDMAFFGYMEGALRSGERAANQVMLQSCGLPTTTPPPPAARGRLASAGRVSVKRELEHDIVRAERPSNESDETDSPFLNQEVFVKKTGDEWDPRTAALASESPFLDPRGDAREAAEIHAGGEAEESSRFDTEQQDPPLFEAKDDELEDDVP